MAARAAAAARLADAESSIPGPGVGVDPLGDDGGAGLREFLLEKYRSGSMPAVELTSLCYHIMRSGGIGVGDLALNPSNAHAAEHVRRALGGDSNRFYKFQLPVWDHEMDSRMHIDFHIRLPHEIFAASWSEDPASWDPLNFEIADLPPQFSWRVRNSFFWEGVFQEEPPRGFAPPILAKLRRPWEALWKTSPQTKPFGTLRFSEHEVHVENPGKTSPVGFFADGVPHTKRDSFVVTYLSKSLTRQRFLVSSVRKSDLCRCGCRGHCTVGQINRVVSWSFDILARGFWPDENHEGGPLDHERQMKRGFPLAEGWVGALTELRFDLLELVETGGFKT